MMNQVSLAIVCTAVEWMGHQFSLIDTGGIEIVNRPFQEQIRMQANHINGDIIVFVVDGRLGLQLMTMWSPVC